jgi:SEC-C motif-containing protein
MAKIGRNDPCPCGSGKKYKKCCEDKESGLLVVEDRSAVQGPQMQLVIDTKDGPFVRNVSAALPRRLQHEQGKEAESATHAAAAIWGLADFVFEPAHRRRNAGVRELGDGVLVLGELAVVLQVKSREAVSDNEDRERRWIRKAAKKALAQGAGTVREFCREPAELTNLRGRSIRLDGKEVDWLVAVIIDHDDPPRDVALEPSSNAVVLLRRDWDFLFEQLKSTHGVARYLGRVAGEKAVLGDEPVRYYELAAADEEAPPKVLDPAYRLPGMKQIHEPLLPMAPAATEDEADHRLIRAIMEDIASIKTQAMPEEMRVRALAYLDSLPTRQRAMAGQFLRDGFLEARRAKGGVAWRQRRIFGEGAIQLTLGVCSRLNPETEGAFTAWMELRHHEFSNRIDQEGSVTVGVLVTPRRNRKKPWDTTMAFAEGQLDLTPEQLAAYTKVWRSEKDLAA